jgi:hypothetical protein
MDMGDSMDEETRRLVAKHQQDDSDDSMYLSFNWSHGMGILTSDQKYINYAF